MSLCFCLSEYCFSGCVTYVCVRSSHTATVLIPAVEEKMGNLLCSNCYVEDSELVVDEKYDIILSGNSLNVPTPVATEPGLRAVHSKATCFRAYTTSSYLNLG